MAKNTKLGGEDVSGCKNLSLAGLNWRRPNLKESESLYDESRALPALDKTFFPGVVHSNYDSNSTYPPLTSDYRGTNSFYGGVNHGDKFGSSYARCVSDG